MKWLLATIIVTAAGCGPATRTDSSSAIVVWRERVATREAWTNVSDVPWMFRRISRAPAVGPFYVLISSSGRFCPVDPSKWNEVHNGVLFECAWQWPS